MAQRFCRTYVDNVFSKWDKDNSNILSRQELKQWLKEQQTYKPVLKTQIRENFFEMIATADSNGDGKIDRWQLYEYCLKSYVPESHSE